MTVIENGRVVTESEVLENCSVLIDKDRIAELVPNGRPCRVHGGDTRLDASGGYVMPGFVDIHSDYLESVASPRPTALMDFGISVCETERMLMVHGITTMYHSLSLLKADMFSAKPVRNQDNVARMIGEIIRARKKDHLIRNRLHLRFEIDNIDKVEELRRYLQNGDVDLLSFMDHTPGQGQYRNLETYRKTIQGYKNISAAQADRLIRNNMHKELLTWDTIRELTKLAQSMGVAVASHDDDSPEKIRLIHDLGIGISEFPITLQVAKKAKEMGLITVGGSPNILLGKSHSGNLSVTQAILENAIDVLCSDYYPAAMLLSVFQMAGRYGIPLADMVAMATLNPAKAVGADREIGSIAPGKKADILIVRKIGSVPYVASSIIDGNVIFQSMYRCSNSAYDCEPGFAPPPPEGEGTNINSAS
ncbi:Alpha-D-ribose 1-methylphosphonate 5-triphosphate diphosphatase [Ruminococcaceae bacterium BL-6]|nr:Alpha-D-ribose 1-methylphosphonate 5-triphosphate diphosphatase [Ruminococcaceae bacterium BL-6]